MIRYALQCSACGAAFDGWFSSSDGYDEQKDKGLVTCAACGSPHVGKQIMAPAVRTRDNVATPDPARALKEMSKAIKSHLETEATFVGDDFAHEARAMYYGEKDAKPVYGRTTVEEAKELYEEGVPAIPIPDDAVPEQPVDPKKVN